MKAFKAYVTGFRAGFMLGRLAAIAKIEDPVFNVGVSHGRMARAAVEDFVRNMYGSAAPYFS